MLRVLVIAGSLAAVLAQTPPYNGQLLVKPALTTNKCLAAASDSDGATVSIQVCTGDSSQQWTFSGGSLNLPNNKCLDVTDGNTNDGALLQVWTCAPGNPNQQFYYNHWANQLVWPTNGKCLDLTDGKTDVGNRPQLWQCFDGNGNQIWNTGYMASQLPDKSQDNQFGTNNCVGGPNQDANCQTLWLNSAHDFALFAPPYQNSTVGETEAIAVGWFVDGVRSGRLIPEGTLQGVHFLRAKSYVQVTGIGNFTKMNIRKGDLGGEYDCRGEAGLGNPAGGQIYGNSPLFGDGTQFHEWTEFISDNQFCIRACVGTNAMRLCNHIYDIMGCEWNIGGSYDPGFEECDSDDALPMGVYDGTSTWHQGTEPTPPPHPAPASSNCVQYPTITQRPLKSGVPLQSTLPSQNSVPLQSGVPLSTLSLQSSVPSQSTVPLQSSASM